jgi:catechol 2,3-dioxygenase-like lactoylglutathione lyase family enzyme
MDLGTFSISLAVKDLAASRAFYEKLGFEVSGGNPEHNYLILRNGHQIIGLFQGMFDRNILTFNPGWNHECEEVNPFTDVREIQKALLENGVELNEKVDEGTTGPGHITLTDPDGNPILIDQHR